MKCLDDDSKTMLRGYLAGLGMKNALCGYDYCHRARTHLSLKKDAPEIRPVQPSERGSVVELPEVGGPHHPYERLAA